MYEIVDVVDMWFPKFALLSDCTFSLYITKAFYDKQVLHGQMTSLQIRNQIQLDCKRSIFCYNGKRVLNFDELPNLPWDILRYCNQTVMGFPVDFLTRHGIVAEKQESTPLYVNIWDKGKKCIVVKKALRIIKKSKYMNIDIQLKIHLNDPCILMKLKSHEWQPFNEF